MRAGKSRRQIAAKRIRQAVQSGVETLERRVLLDAMIQSPFAAGELLADRSRNIVYLIDKTNNKIDAIDTNTGRMTAAATVRGLPTSLAESLDGSRLFVASADANSIQVYSLPDLGLQSTFTLTRPGMMAEGVGNRLYVGWSAQSAYIRALDSQTGALLYSFGSYYQDPFVRVDPTGTKLEVAGFVSGGSVTEYDASYTAGGPSAIRTLSATMAYPQDAAYDAAYNQLYIAQRDVNGLQVVNLSANTSTTWVSGSTSNPVAGLAFNSAVSYVVLGSAYTGYSGLYKFSRATGAAQGVIWPTGLYAVMDTRAIGMTPNGNIVYTYRARATSGGSTTQRIAIVGSGVNSLTVGGLPTSRIISATGALPNQPVAFDGTSSAPYLPTGSITNWAWDFGGGVKTNGQVASHPFTTPGVYTVTLTVTDNSGNTNSSTSTIRVTNRPAAAAVTAQTNEETAVTIPLLGTDPDSDPVAYRVVQPPQHGTITISGANAIYTPAALFHGPDSFTYVANDAVFDSTPAVGTIGVSYVNHPPVPRPDVMAIDTAGSPGTVDVLANDSDAEGQVTLQSYTSPTRGTLSLNGSTFTYTPTTTYQGLDGFDYTIVDSDGATANAHVTIAAGVASTGADWFTFGGSAARAGYQSGFVGTAWPVRSWSLPASSDNGRQVTVGGGRVYFTCDNPRKIVAIDPADGHQLWSTSLTGNNSVGQPTYYNGYLYVQVGNSSSSKLHKIDAATGSIVWSATWSSQFETYYAPAVDDNTVWIGGGTYGGMYGFRVSDGSQIAFVGMTQTDKWAPALYGGFVYAYDFSNFSCYRMDGSQVYRTAIAGSGTTGTAAFAGGRAFVRSSTALYCIDPATGAILWTDATSGTGTPAVVDGVVYTIAGTSVRALRVSDGTLLRTYVADQALDQQPIVTDDSVVVASSAKTYIFSRQTGALRATAPKGGKVALAGNQLLIATSSLDLFAYKFASGNNTPPVTVADFATVASGTSIKIAVAANDYDPDAQVIVVTDVGSAANGTVTLNADGTVNYVSKYAFYGTDTFSYILGDSAGGVSTGMVTVTVTKVNHAPYAYGVTQVIPTIGTTALTFNASDPDNDPLSYRITVQPTHGTVSTADGVLCYTPTSGYKGSDSLQYVANDGTVDSGAATVTLRVDDPPVPVDVAATTNEDTAVPITLVATDANGDTISYSVAVSPAHGTVSISGGIATYTPAANYFGSDTFRYYASDGVASMTARVVVTVNPVNDAPVGSADSAVAITGRPTILPDVLSNDSDVDGDALQIASFTQPAHGTLTQLVGGVFVYTSASGFQGLDSFTYVPADYALSGSPVTVSLDVGSLSLTDNWPIYGHDAGHTGYIAGSALGASITDGLSWPDAAVNYMPPVTIADGKVFISQNASMFAYDARTGAKVWQTSFSTSYGGDMSQATWYGGRLYATLNNGPYSQLLCVDAATGADLWQASYSTQSDIYLAPVVTATGIWIGGGQYGGIYSFAFDGSQTSFKALDQVSYWTPASDGSAVYAYTGTHLTKLNSAGVQQWQIARTGVGNNWLYRSCTVSGSRLYVSDGSGLSAIDTATGSQIWNVSSAGGYYTPAVAGGRVYGFSGRYVKAFDAATGSLLMTYDAGAAVTLSDAPVVTDTALFASTGTLTYMWDLASGTLIKTLAHGGKLSLANNALYVTTTGNVYSYVLKAPTAQSSVPDLVDASDTGISNTDNITSDNTPTFVGSAPTGSHVYIFVDGARAGDTTADGNGQWTFTLPAMPDGYHDVSAAAVTGQSGVGSASLHILLLATVPAKPAAPLLASVSDTGVSNSDGITAINTPTLQVPAGLLLYNLLRNGITILSGQTASCITLPAQPDGTWQYQLEATDADGNASAPSDPCFVTIDTSVPATPLAPVVDAAFDTGVSSSDGITANSRPTLDLAGFDGMYNLYVDGNLVSALATAPTWTPLTALADGTHSVRLTSVHMAGNESVAATLVLTIDTLAPTTPVAPDLDASIDSGASNTDNITRFTDLLLNVSASPYFRLYDGSTLLSSAYATGSQFTVFAQVEGVHNYRLTQVDAAGNESVAATLQVTIDTTAPDAPTAGPFLDPSYDTGTSNSDGLTFRNILTFNVSSPDLWFVYLDGVQQGATASSSSTWTSPTLADGTHSVSLCVMDAAGNVSAIGVATLVTVDTTPPAPPVITGLVPQDDSGISNSDGITNVNGATLQLAYDGVSADVSYYVGNTGNTTTSTFKLPPWAPPGRNVVTAYAYDAAGNKSAASQAYVFYYEPYTPLKPAAPRLDPASDLGSSNSDNITSSHQPVLVLLPPAPIQSVWMTVMASTLPGSLSNIGAGLAEVDPATGNLLRVIPFDAPDAWQPNYISIATGNGRVYVSTGNPAWGAGFGDLYVYDATSGSLIRDVPCGVSGFPSLGFANGKLYALISGGIEQIDPVTGAAGPITPVTLNGTTPYLYRSIVGTGDRGTMIVGGGGTLLYEFDPATGIISRTISLPNTTGDLQGLAYINGQIVAAGIVPANQSTSSSIFRYDIVSGACLGTVASPSWAAGGDLGGDGDAPARQAQYYRIYRDGVQVSGDYALPSSFTDDVLADGAHTYAVVAVDAAGNVSSISDPLTVTYDFTPVTAPAAVVNAGDAQRSLVSGLDVTFAEDVTLAPDAIRVVYRNGAAVPNTDVNVTELDSQHYHITFSGAAVQNGSIADGSYKLVVSAAGVQDLAGNAMTANYRLKFFRLFGDINGDRAVNRADLVQFRQFLASGSYNAASDFNNDGVLDLVDYRQLRKRLQQRLL